MFLIRGFDRFEPYFLAFGTVPISSAPGVETPSVKIFETMFQAFNNTKNGNPSEPTGPTANNPEDIFGMSRGELDQMLMYCGLQGGEEDSLPHYFKLSNRKKLSKDARNRY